MLTQLRRWRLLVLLGGLCFGGGQPHASYAQSVTCDAVINNLNRAIGACDEINDNWVCYGSKQAEAAPVKYRFKNTRDRRPLAVLETINTLDKKGVVVMNLHVAGQTAPVTGLLFGPVQTTSGVQSNPPIFSLQVDNSGGLLCAVTPPGMVVRTETGQRAVVKVNGVTIELGSTVFITVRAANTMLIVNIEGHVTLTLNGVVQVLAVGEQATFTLVDGTATAMAAPVPSAVAGSSVLRWLASADGLGRVHNTNETVEACTGRFTFGDTLTLENIEPGQECLVNFCANAGDVVTVDMNALTPGLNPWLDLRGPDGRVISFNDDVGQGDQDSQLCNRVLPFSSCNYTLVARTAHNLSAGPFQLTLNRQTPCVPAPLRCEVVSPEGVNLRRGPGVEYARVGGLAYGAQVQPLERTADGAWTLVQVGVTDQRGWVHQDPNLVECEDDSALTPIQPQTDPTPTATAEPEKPRSTATPSVTPTDMPTDTPTDMPTATPTVAPPTPTGDPCQVKCGPFPGP